MSLYKGTTLISGIVPDMANQSLSNLNSTGQAVIDGKASIDLANVTDAGKILMSSMGMPSNTYTNLTLGASGTTYTAPADGWFVLNKSHGANTSLEIITMQNYCGGSTMWTDGLIRRSMLTVSGISDGIFMPAKKGDRVFVLYSYSGATNAFRFYYAKGSESEAS